MVLLGRYEYSRPRSIVYSPPTRAANGPCRAVNHLSWAVNIHSGPTKPYYCYIDMIETGQIVQSEFSRRWITFSYSMWLLPFFSEELFNTISSHIPDFDHKNINDKCIIINSRFKKEMANYVCQAWEKRQSANYL